MELEELTAYARRRYGMREEFKWAEHPELSVLAHPRTKKWTALLIRRRDPETGAVTPRCDLRCPRRGPEEPLPFRMKGPQWRGVELEGAVPEEVFALLDRAMAADEPPADPEPARQAAIDAVFRATALPERESEPEARGIPGKIWEMMELYQFADGSFQEKCRNFARQGKFMEDFEDDAPWIGELRRYFPTYHDLTPAQLRGYFTWRTAVRRGTYPPVALSLAYLYLYELLQGIGAGSPRESLEKLRAFETGFLDRGLGDEGMRRNLHRWMLEFAVLRDVPPREAAAAAGPGFLARDAALTALRHPEEAQDEAVFDALVMLGDPKLGASPAVMREEARGKRLFAQVWREAAARWQQEGKDLFAACFGAAHVFPWHPLSNAVHWEEEAPRDRTVELSEFRVFRCRGGFWQEERIEELYFDKPRLTGLLHEADRQLRLYLKTGRPLRERPQENWARPIVQEVIRREEEALREAARPKITLDPAALARIRREAGETRESLLTQEEREEDLPQTPPAPPAAEEAPAREELPLEPRLVDILAAVLRGEPAGPLLAKEGLMASVVTDDINQALFDRFGDSVLDCDGREIAPVEDYREELAALLGGKTL